MDGMVAPLVVYLALQSAMRYIVAMQQIRAAVA
jgi:hypothetical protein